MSAQTWDEAREIDQQWRLWFLARYVASHRQPKDMAYRLEKRHGQGLLPKLRARLKAGPPTEERRPLC